MGEKSTVFGQKVKYKGFFDYSELYSYVYDWLKDAGYTVKEPEYSEKISGTKKDISIEWECDADISDYYKKTITVGWTVSGMEDAEVQVDGEKKSMNKGSLMIKIGAQLEADPKNEWEKKPVYKFFRGIYDKYIVDTVSKEAKKNTAIDASSLVDDIKSFLNIAGK